MKFEELIEDEEIIKIGSKASQSFTDCLSKDEIRTCIMSALWSATNNYKEGKNTKFTTYFYKGVVYECIKQKKINNKKNKLSMTNFPINQVFKKNELFDRIDILEEINTLKDADIIKERFYLNFTLEDIAKKRGISKEAVRFKLKKNLNFLKSRLS